MQRVKPKEKQIIANNLKQQTSYIFNNNIPNGNVNKNIEQNTFINNNIISNRSNKFLSIPERQKIIREINESKNQLNLYHPPEPHEIIQIDKSEETKNLLYIKKTKSNLNLGEKNKSGSMNNKNIKNILGKNHIKFSKNKNLINKTIKEYCKKNENPFKTYLKTLNNDLHDDGGGKITEKVHFQNPSFYSNNTSNNQIKSRNYNNFKELKIESNEIYKKPISTKIYNKPNVINNNVENKHSKNKTNTQINLNLKKLYITNSARKEKINCAKMINNNGVKKNIFNIINNYNTKTIKNNTIKVNFSQRKQNIINEFLKKNNSSSNFKLKNNNFITNNNKLNETYNKDYLYKRINNLNITNKAIGYNLKNQSSKNNKSLSLLNPIFLKEEINKRPNNNVLTINDYYTLNDKPKMIYNTNSNHINLKYIKKNIQSPAQSTLPKKRVFSSNFMSNDLPRILVEKDLISFSMGNKKSDLDTNNGKLNKNYNEQINEKNNENNIFFSQKDYYLQNDNNNYIDNKKNIFINTDIKRNSNNSLFLSLEKSSKKENKRNKSFSYISNKDDETEDNYFYQNGKKNYKCQNGKSISPSYKEFNNFYRPLITHEVVFPFNINKNNSYYYNSDDDIMNSNNNSNIGSYTSGKNVITGVNNNSFDNRTNNNILNNNYKFNNKRKNNIFTPNQSPSPTKDYYFNYLSNKINNDFLNENKFNKLDKNLYNSEFLNKNTFCEKCKRNYCPYCCRLSPEFDIYNNIHINKKIKSPKYFYKNYCPTSFHSKSISMNFENNNLKNNLILNDIERNENDENNKLKNKKIISTNVDLKLDVSNGKHSFENMNQNINNTPIEVSSFNSNKLELIENDINKNTKKETQILNEEKNIDNKDENKIIDEIKIKENNIEIEMKNKKESEIDKTEQIKSISEITSSGFLIKGEGINLSTSEFILNVTNNNNTNRKSAKNSYLSKDTEEKGNKLCKKMNDIIQNIQVTPTTKRNSFIKDISITINNNDVNFTKTDIDSNINNNTGIIIKNFTINEDLSKKNYINNKFESESPILCDILENLNKITLKNYFLLKDKLFNIIINNNENISVLFISILYSIATNQRKFQSLYAKLCKDIDKCHNKKDKSKSVIRTQLMKHCKSNFKKIKYAIENIVYIENDINFIGELINAQMVSKKVGVQCLTHLMNKFNQYNTDENLKNRRKEKYLYLDNIINLFNQFATCVLYYQKEKIRKEEMILFKKDIFKITQELIEIKKNVLNKDMPITTKIELFKLIKKSEENWELTLIEKSRNQLLKMIYEEPDKNTNNNINNNKTENNKNLNKQYKSLSPNNNKNIDKHNVNTNKGKQKINLNNNKNNEYSKIIEDNLILFKIHMDEYKSSDNFNNWKEIDNLFLNKKIEKTEIYKSIIEASKNFIKEKNDIYYLDLYIKIIFEYYYCYLNKGDINKITNAILEELNLLTNEQINKKPNIIEIWIVIIYYLLQNKIISMNDFNYFCQEFNKEIKKNIFTILNGVCNYNKDNKNQFLLELKNTKLANINKDISNIS